MNNTMLLQFKQTEKPAITPQTAGGFVATKATPPTPDTTGMADHCAKCANEFKPTKK